MAVVSVEHIYFCGSDFVFIKILSIVIPCAIAFNATRHGIYIDSDFRRNDRGNGLV